MREIIHLRVVLVMLVLTLMWSTAGVVAHHLDAARSFGVTFWRSFFAVLSLLVILPLWQGRKIWSEIE